MSNRKNNYVSKIYNLAEQYIGFNNVYKNPHQEEKYQEFYKDYESKKSKIYCVFSILGTISSFQTILSNNQFQFDISTFLLLVAIIIELLLFCLSHKCLNSYNKVFFLIKYIRFFSTYLLSYVSTFFALAQVSLDLKIRYLYRMFLILHLNYIYFLDYNLVIGLCLTIFNILYYILIQIKYFDNFYLVSECIGNFIFNFFCFIIKKNEIITKKSFFSELCKNEYYTDYIQELVNVLNTMVITFNNNKEILYMNKISQNFLGSLAWRKNNSNYSYLVSEGKEIDQLFKKEDFAEFDSKNLQLPMKILLDSLTLDSKGKKGSDFSWEKGMKLNDILSEIFKENNFISKEFLSIGYFTYDIEGKKSFYEVLYRKMKINEEIVELLVYNVSEIKFVEKTNAETKYKQKILAKIAHEFKTPLITITSFINNLVEFSSKCDRCQRTSIEKLKHIENLSNYSIILISDIIQYISGLEKKIKKYELDIREVVTFCNQVLDTLVTCNFFKGNNIKTSLHIDEGIDNVKITSNENKLKQILLNFISNSVKFTKKGFIKLIVQYDFILNKIKIIVKDSGIGIKDEEKSLIFNENIQLNTEDNYNIKGSGLGLSISKAIADSLGHEIGFSSTFQKGSEFYLNISCAGIVRTLRENYKQRKDILLQIPQEKEGSYVKLNKSLQFFNYTERLKDNVIKIEENSSQSQTIIINNLNFVDETNIKEFKDYENLMNNTGRSNLMKDLINVNENCSYFLVVDDLEFVRKNTSNLLRSVFSDINKSDYKIIECSDGIELLNYVMNDKENRIKCIFIDENMEYLNGSETVKIMRTLEEKSKINKYHIVSITAFDDHETKNCILKSGVNSIVVKPCSKSSIIDTLKRIGIES